MLIIHNKKKLESNLPEIKQASIEKMNQIRIQFSGKINWDFLETLTLLDSQKQLVDYKRQGDSQQEDTINLFTKKGLDLTKPYTLTFKDQSVPVTTGAVVRTKEFDDLFSYDGPLGALYHPNKTIFRLWAPTCCQVELLLFENNAPDAALSQVLPMKKGARGTYEISLFGDRKNQVYQYRLSFPDGKINETGDPYAKAAIINGDRSVVLSPTETQLTNFKRMSAFSKPEDAIIYELHIRDFSIAENSGIKNKGKFLGVVETGTKNKKGQMTGLDYLKDLGVTHVQILPMFDYGSIDEEKVDKPQYNWGYDPKNYNVPEGSYSTDPTDPKNRILEMKEMIANLHEAGLRVIMDVVYNHVHSANDHAFNKVVPGYYFRYDESGKLVAGSGVKNDTASERKMMRKYIIDSVYYWAKEYSIDGFRFDLMGIHDIETMNDVRKTLDEIDSSIIVLGEGWDLPTSLDDDQKASQKNAQHIPHIAHFNDALRDDTKGHVFEAEKPGFINGGKNLEVELLKSMMGGQALDSIRGNYLAPNQLIQYTEAHDNLTLFDKLMITNPNDTDQQRQARHLLGTSIPLLSQGIPFLHAGQEFMRTKNGDENSFKSPDQINQIDWDRPYKYKENVSFIKELITFRKNQPLLRLNSYEEIKKHIIPLIATDQLIAYELKNKKESYLVVLNASNLPQELGNKALGNYKIYLTSVKTKRKNEFPALSVTILKQK